MDVKDVIDKRISPRHFQDKGIPDNIIKDLLDAARKAPSAHNAQSYKFFVINSAKDKEVLEKLREAHAFEQDLVYEAPLILVCTGDPTSYPEAVEVDDSAKNYALIDLTLATAFLVLRGQELGLGSRYIAWIRRKEIREILNIPDNYIIPYVLAIGHPKDLPERKKKKSIEEIIF